MAARVGGDDLQVHPFDLRSAGATAATAGECSPPEEGGISPCANDVTSVGVANVVTAVVALRGDLNAAVHTAEIGERLQGFTVVAQRGSDFADRLANAHADAADGRPVLQIGMDTPQLSAALLTACAQRLLAAPAVLGPARDGGWWMLGVHTPTDAECLRGVPMSRPDTGALTWKALRASGVEPEFLAELADVDTVEDIAVVRGRCAPGSRFAAATTSWSGSGG